MFRFACPHCKTIHRAEDEERGSILTCTQCAKKIRVPAAKTPPRSKVNNPQTRAIDSAAKKMAPRRKKVNPTLIEEPTRVRAAGNKPKLIDEYIGRVNSKHKAVSIAHMRSPGGWTEPGQTPDFEEYTVVLKGTLRVTFADGAIDVNAGQAVITHPGEWIQYSTPDAEGAEYIAVCLPAFSPNTVHRDE